MATKIKYTTIMRRGYEITMPKDVYTAIKADNYNVQLVFNSKNEPSSVQLTSGGKYAGTLKNYMGVSGFKDMNPCNFRKSNVIAD